MTGFKLRESDCGASFLNLCAMLASYNCLMSFLLFLSHRMQWEVYHGGVARTESSMQGFVGHMRNLDFILEALSLTLEGE